MFKIDNKKSNIFEIDILHKFIKHRYFHLDKTYLGNNQNVFTREFLLEFSDNRGLDFVP